MGNGIPGDGNDNWKTQLRGNDGRWINMYGSVSFDYTPSGGGPTKKGRGTFQGVSTPGRAKIFVKDDPELEVGLYEVQSQYVQGVKAFIPTAANKPESKPAVEEPSTPELKDEITGDEAMQVVRNAGAQYAKSQGRFAMSRTYDDVRQGLRAQYMQFLDGIKKDNPELLKNQFIINEDGTGRTGDIETEDDFWGAITAMQVSTSSRWVSPKDINPLAKEVNRRYAEKFLGVKKDGLISFYRNVIQEKEDPADAAAGYASLDKKMAWDYNPDARPGDVLRGRYIVKAKPDEVLGILGYSGALDEFGVVISPEVTSLPGRFERVGDLEKQRIDGAPWVDYEELDKLSRFGGGSPFRFLAPMTNFDYYALDSSPFGEGDGWASFYEANGGLQQGAMPNKYNELYGEGAWEKDFGDGSPRASQFANLFIKFTDKDGKEKWGLDAPKLRELSNIDMLNNAESGDDFDRNIKVLSTMQELMGKPFFVNKGHDQSDSRIPKRDDAGGSEPIARLPEPVDAPNVEESAASDVPPYRFENSSTGWNYEDEHVVGTNPENSPTDEEVDSIVDYIGKGYTQMNAAARGEGTGDSSFSEEEIAASIENLTNLIDRNPPLGTTALVYRGVYDSADIKWSELEVGSEFVDKGFVSTSPNAATAGSFGTIQLEIELGEDTKAIDVSRTLDGTKAPPIEQELILQRGTKFEVVAKTENGFRLRVVGSAEPEPLSAPKPEPDTTTPNLDNVMDDYRMSHRPPSREDTLEEGVAASLDKIDEVFPKDILDPSKQAQLFGSGYPEADKEAFDIINSIKGNPDAEVTIYRGAPGDVDDITPGDWVTLSSKYAQTHVDSNVPGGKVLSKKVKASDLFTSADSVQEWGWDPAKPAPDADESVEAPKRREVSSRDMQREFPTAGDPSELKNKVTQKLLERILAKGVTKDELVDALYSLKKFRILNTVDKDKNPDWDTSTGIVKWEGSKKLSEVKAAAIKTIVDDEGREVESIAFGNLDVALRNAVRIYNIDDTKDDIPEFTESMTYGEAVEYIRKINNLIDEKHKKDKSYIRQEFVFEDNVEKARDNMAYWSVSSMVKEWAASSNDDNFFSLALQETVAKLFNLENYLPWTVDKEVSEKRDTFIELHEKVIRAYAEAQYEATQEELKAKGITSVQLYRGMNDPDLRVTLGEYGYLDDNLVILRPLSSFSYDVRIAEGFAGDDTNSVGITYDQLEEFPDMLEDVFGSDFFDTPPVLKSNEYINIYGDIKQFGGVVLNTTVDADKIFSMPFSGVGCLSEAEVVVIGPNLRADIITPQEAEEIANQMDLEAAEEEED